MFKVVFKKFIIVWLKGRVKKYFRINPSTKIVVVVGSVGKTSTKTAIATVLSEKFRVRVEAGNLNSELSAPLAILGIEFPSNIRSFGQWLGISKKIKSVLSHPDSVEIIVQELGTDRVGQIASFGKYLKPNLAVVTAVSQEHMEFFKTIDNVAKEELSIQAYAKQVLVNIDDINSTYLELIDSSRLKSYSLNNKADYTYNPEDVIWEGTKQLPGNQILKAAVAAMATAKLFGMTDDEIKNGLSRVKTVRGRMNILQGQNNSTIIDDSYNSSPLAVKAALDALYGFKASQRIAVLGDMNELGDTTEAEHKKLGSLCDFQKLSYVVTVGKNTAEFLAPVARAGGCQVKSFKTALEAGSFVHQVLEPGSVVLFKGSEGGVFLEEAIKIILKSTTDENQLVRQSSRWLEKKRKFFASIQ